MIKPFVFQEFTVAQSEKVFRVGTDGVLLGALSRLPSGRHILEVGTGTGLVSLMLAQRFPEVQITALDINESAVDLAKINFQNSPFFSRLSIENQDFKLFQSEVKYDLIVCNPPYFEENNSVKDVLARQRIELDFSDLIANSRCHLTDNGVLSVIIPYLETENFVQLCQESALHLIRFIKIIGREGNAPKRSILEFSLNYQEVENQEFIIEKSPRMYSSQYLELTKEFHCFRK